MLSLMKTSDFDYVLPPELIAQTPVSPRDASRMLVCNRSNHARRHHVFRELPSFLRPQDVMVINETRVIPARLLGLKAETGVPVEFLLLKRLQTDVWEALVKPGRRLHEGTMVSFGDGLLQARVEETLKEGTRKVRFVYEGLFENILETLGETPLPPYIHEKLSDRGRYQTIYARQDGSAAAPTAGLHFTQEILDRIRSMGIEIVPVLLHVGLGTFRPVKAEEVTDHAMHSEYYEVGQEAAGRINFAKSRGGRIVCIGTTSVRTLETVADSQGIVHPGSGETSIFIKPGVQFKACDMLLTNFHLPQSTLLMLVSAFMGRSNALSAYEEAVREGYRFFSFGDCMLIGEDLM